MDYYEAPLVLVDKDGRSYINEERLGENYFVLRLNDYPFTVAASSQGFSGFSIPEGAGHSGDFEIFGLAGFSTAPFRIKFSDVGVAAGEFMNQPIHHNHVFGLGGLPFVLAESIFEPAGRLIQVQVNNLSTNIENAVRLVAVGRQVNSEMDGEAAERRAAFLANRPTRPYWLTFDNSTISVTLSASATNTEAFMTMPSGSHFACDSIMVDSTGPFEFALFDGQSGRALTFGQGGTGFVDSRILGGTGTLPAKMLGAPLLQPRRSIRILMNELTGASNVVHLTLHGRRMRLPVGVK